MATLEIMEYDESHKTAQSSIESVINQWLGVAGREIGVEPRFSRTSWFRLHSLRGRMARATSWLSWSRRLYSDASHRGASACPNSVVTQDYQCRLKIKNTALAASKLAHFQTIKGLTRGPFIHLVAGTELCCSDSREKRSAEVAR